MKGQEENVYQVTQKILSKLKAQEEMASGKAALAALRHSLGKLNHSAIHQLCAGFYWRTCRRHSYLKMV